MKFKVICVILSLSAFTGINAQNISQVADSIMSLKISDTAKVNIFRDLADSYVNVNNSLNIYYLEKALPLAEKSNSYPHKFYCYNNLSISYGDKLDMQKALYYSTLAIKLSEQENNRLDILYSYVGIGIIYSTNQNNPKAKEYFNKSLLIADELKNDYKRAEILVNISILFNQHSEKDSALKYINVAYVIFKKHKDTLRVSAVLNTFANIYKTNNEYDKALRYYEEAGQVAKSANDYFTAFTVMREIGDLYLKEGKYELALKEFSDALKLFSGKGYLAIELNCYRGLAGASKAVNLPDKAYEYLSLYYQLKDSLITRESLGKRAELEVSFQVELDKKQIEILKSENSLKESRNRTFIYIIIFICGFIIVVGYLIYVRYKIKRKAEEALKEKNRLIEEKNKEILDSIHYAKRIQSSLITSEKYIEKNLDRLNERG